MGQVLVEWREGTYSSLKNLLENTIKIYVSYNDRERFHVLFTNVVIPGLGFTLVTLAIIIVLYKKRGV